MLANVINLDCKYFGDLFNHIFSDLVFKGLGGHCSDCCCFSEQYAQSIYHVSELDLGVTSGLM
jgi:hypothetical protein